MVEIEENYTLFSQVYDAIMDDSLYDRWLAFSQRHFFEGSKNILELACGTGILSKMFLEKGYKVTGLDLSQEMLDIAKKRVPQVDFQQGDMRELNFAAEFDAVTCYSDSVCYLSDLSEVEATANGVWSALKENGVFIFDVHSTHQIDDEFPGFAYHDNAEDFAFVWDSYEGDEPHSISHELTFFVKNPDGTFTRKDEVHDERTYEIKDYLSALKKFKSVEVYADFEDQAPSDNSLRWFFVCKK